MIKGLNFSHNERIKLEKLWSGLSEIVMTYLWWLHWIFLGEEQCELKGPTSIWRIFWAIEETSPFQNAVVGRVSPEKGNICL